MLGMGTKMAQTLVNPLAASPLNQVLQRLLCVPHCGWPFAAHRPGKKTASVPSVGIPSSRILGTSNSFLVDGLQYLIMLICRCSTFDTTTGGGKGRGGGGSGGGLRVVMSGDVKGAIQCRGRVSRNVEFAPMYSR